jgi:hypothetical protein
MWRASAARRAPSSSGRRPARRRAAAEASVAPVLATAPLPEHFGAEDEAWRLACRRCGKAWRLQKVSAGARGNAASARGGLPGARGGTVDGLLGWPPVSASRRGRACEFTFDTVPSPK